MIVKVCTQIRGLAFALVGRLALAAGTSLLVMGVGSMILGPVPPSNGLGGFLLPSEGPELESAPPIVDAFPTLTLAPITSPSPALSVSSGTTPVPTPTPQTHLVTRVVLARANVDLPVVEPKPNETFPYCDVAERITYYTVPGNDGLTYLYAHARPRMFGGLLVASWKPDSYLLGALVKVYTDDNLVYTYKVTEIHRGQKYTSWVVADGLVGESLILQASETATRNGTKLIVVARPVKVGAASFAAAHPDARPRVCS